jgi:hypothetical protein
MRRARASAAGNSVVARRLTYTTALAASLLSLATAGWMVFGPARPAVAYTIGPPSEGLKCTGESLAALGVLEAHLSPANGTSVQAGSSVTFSGESSAPLTFSIASSPELLSSPDVDTGPGTPGTEPVSSGQSPFYTYTFTSTKAAATPRTVYWQASFSDATFPECQKGSPSTFTTKPQTLTVVPAPTPAPTPAPQPEPPPPAPAAPVGAPVAGHPRLKVRVSATASFDRAHPTISYRVQCSASCKGRTTAEIFVLRRHAKPQRVAELGFGPSLLSMASANGGYQQFAHRYSDGALRTLERLFRTGGTVELQIHVNATGAAGEPAQAPSTTIRLRYEA